MGTTGSVLGAESPPQTPHRWRLFIRFSGFKNIIFRRVLTVCNSLSSAWLSPIQPALLSEVTGSAGFRPISFSSKMERITLSIVSDAPDTPYHSPSLLTSCCGSLALSCALRKRIRLSGCRFVFGSSHRLFLLFSVCVVCVGKVSRSNRAGFAPLFTPHHTESLSSRAFTMTNR